MYRVWPPVTYTLYNTSKFYESNPIQLDFYNQLNVFFSFPKIPADLQLFNNEPKLIIFQRYFVQLIFIQAQISRIFPNDPLK
jgi:hypothetical protein